MGPASAQVANLWEAGSQAWEGNNEVRLAVTPLKCHLAPAPCRVVFTGIPK